MTIRPCPASTGLFLVALALAGCAGERLSFGNNQQEPAYTGSIRPQQHGDMTGRWVLVSPGRGQCHMSFAGGPGAPNGGIAPEGGCPGNFFTSRNWNYEQAGLVLRDHTGQPLGQLSSAGNARFDGRSAAGEPITLYR